MEMTRQYAWAAARDAADRQARRAGRTEWNTDDYNLAVATFNRLWPWHVGDA